MDITEKGNISYSNFHACCEQAGITNLIPEDFSNMRSLYPA